MHDIDIDLQTNDVVLRCGPHTALDLASVPVAIREGGFRPAELELTARGTITRDGAAFRPDGWSLELPFTAAAAASFAGAEGAHVHLVAAVEGWEDDGAIVLVPIEFESLASPD